MCRSWGKRALGFLRQVGGITVSKYFDRLLDVSFLQKLDNFLGIAFAAEPLYRLLPGDVIAATHVREVMLQLFISRNEFLRS